MTKEHFDLAAQGAGFLQHKFDDEIWEHPDAELAIWWSETEGMYIRLGDDEAVFFMTRSLSLQRLTHLFKAFQP